MLPNAVSTKSFNLLDSRTVKAKINFKQSCRYNFNITQRKWKYIHTNKKTRIQDVALLNKKIYHYQTQKVKWLIKQENYNYDEKGSQVTHQSTSNAQREK